MASRGPNEDEDASPNQPLIAAPTRNSATAAGEEAQVEKQVESDDRHARLLSWASLILLVFQASAAALLMRWTQTRKTGKLFSTAAVVIVTEFVKLGMCFLGLLYQRVSLRECLNGEPLKMVIPAGLYAFQSNILFVALANLEVTLFQVTYQVKLLLTAVLMVIMLGKQLTGRKWAALLLLFLGIVLTQLDAKKSVKKESTRDQSIVLGLIACFASALSSAVASVYFEKVVKNASTSLLVRNVQLATFSIFIAGSAYPFMERGNITDFFNGFDFAVGVMILNAAAGGLIVAAVIKFADNILKGFATAFAIVVNGLISYVFMDFTPTMAFLCGVVTVMISTTMYSLPDAPAAPAATASDKS